MTGEVGERDELARIALDRARFFAPTVLIAMAWHAMSDAAVDMPISEVAMWWDVGVAASLVGISALAWTGRIASRHGHRALTGIWVLCTSSAVIDQYTAPHPQLGLIVLIVSMSTAVFVETRHVLACLAVLDAVWLPLPLTSDDPAWSPFVIGAIVAQVTAIIIQVVLLRAVRDAERSRRADEPQEESLERAARRGAAIDLEGRQILRELVGHR
jgi:hypothetical protein